MSILTIQSIEKINNAICGVEDESGQRNGGFASRLRAVFHLNGGSCQNLKVFINYYS